MNRHKAYVESLIMSARPSTANKGEKRHLDEETFIYGRTTGDTELKGTWPEKQLQGEINPYGFM